MNNNYNLDKRDYIIMLYDMYNPLFSDRQKVYFEEYYFNNYTLSEIAENLKVSRTAVHKALRLIEKKLAEYEEKLKLCDKRIAMEKILATMIEYEKVDKLREVM